MTIRQKLSLSITDLLMLLFYSVLIPIILLILLLVIGSYYPKDYEFFLVLAILTSLIFLYLLYYFFISRNRVKSLALRVSFFHFQPSWYDLGIHLIRYVYYIIFFGIVLNIIYEGVSSEDLTNLEIGVLAVIFSLGIQVFFIIMAYRSKRRLIITARESVDQEIITKLHSYEPESDLIKEYRFADIQVQTLFLSAGVTSFGYSKNICLISRYFQWKLSEEELISVLLHEIGHISNRHLERSYQIVGLEFVLRTLRIFAILYGIAILRQYGGFVSIPQAVAFLAFSLVAFVSSTLLFLITYYRTFLREIDSDYYSGSRIGFKQLADTLRKLPSLIPSPMGYNQSSFLGFRVALLRDYEKRSNKE